MNLEVILNKHNPLDTAYLVLIFTSAHTMYSNYTSSPSLSPEYNMVHPLPAYASALATMDTDSQHVYLYYRTVFNF